MRAKGVSFSWATKPLYVESGLLHDDGGDDDVARLCLSYYLMLLLMKNAPFPMFTDR